MNIGNALFAQLMDFLAWSTFAPGTTISVRPNVPVRIRVRLPCRRPATLDVAMRSQDQVDRLTGVELRMSRIGDF